MRTARAVDTAELSPDTIKEAIEFIAENLREEDLAELRASVGDLPPAQALLRSWAMSVQSWLILDRTGLPVGIFGVAPHGAPGLGIAWLMGTPGVISEWLSIARQTTQYVGEMHEHFPILWNFVDARNEVSMGWLERAGFRIIDADPTHGPEKRLFLEYARTQPCATR